MNGEDKKQKRLCILLSFMLCFSALITSVVVILKTYMHIPFVNAGFLYILYYGLLLVCCFDAAGTRMPSASFWGISLVLLAYLTTLMAFPSNRRYMWTNALDLMENPTYVFLLFSFAGFVAAPYLKDFEMFQRIFEKFAVVTVSAMALRYVWGTFRGEASPQYMTFSYNLLLPTTFLLLRCILDFRWYRLLLSVLGGILILIAGCRGALLGLIASVLSFVFLVGKMPIKNRNRAKLLLILLAIVVWAFYDQILNFIAQTLNSMGIGSRTINMLIDANFTDDSGRSELQKIILRYINVFGHGLWGDRILLYGRYPHNLLMEILYDFGLLPGTLLIVGLIYVLLHGARQATESKNIIICALISTGFVKLIFSGSFVNIEPALYVLIGLCVSPNGRCIKKGTQ